MAHGSDLAPSSAVCVARVPRRHLRQFTAPARLTGILLLVVWLGPVSFVQTEAWQLFRWAGAPAPVSADQQVIPARQALVLAPGTPLKLHLRDGSVVDGRFLGRALLDSALYAPRFAAYARTSDFVPFALGETLQVSLRDGREWTAPFAGYGELTMLLDAHDGSGPRRLPFEFAKEIRGAGGAWVNPKALARAFQKGALPSAEALVLGERAGTEYGPEAWSSALRVAVQDIQTASVELPSGGSAAGVVIVAVLATLVILYVIAASSFHSSSSGCSSYSGDFSGWLVELTPRAFDRTRSCYVDDPPAVADAWPGETEVPRATSSAGSVQPPDAAAAAGEVAPQNTVDRLN